MVKSKLKKENSVREVYDSENRDHPAIEEIKSLFRYRDLILQLIRRDLVSRYKRSYLGVAWTMLNPLGTMIILAVVFSRVFNDIEAYPVFLLSGLLIWNFFSQSTTHCMSSILWGSNLFDKIYMPRTSFLISSIGTAIINFFLSLIPLILIMLFTKVNIPITILYIPIPIFFISIFSLGVGLILASYSLFFPDIEQMYSIFLRAMMYVTPVLIPEEVLGGILNGILLKINPLYYLIKMFRMLVVEGIFPPSQILWIGFLISIFTLLWDGCFLLKEWTDLLTMPDDRIRSLLDQYDVILRDICVEYDLPDEQIRSIKKYAVRFFKIDRRTQTFFALKHVDLQIEKGEIFGIIGRNGAGKSTLMKVISRVLIPTEGRLITNGQVSPLLQLDAGFHPELTGLENIFLNGTLLGRTRFEIKKKIDNIIAFSDIGDFIHAPVRNYSSGMRARLGFAVATAWQPDILVLDEVLSVGDIAFQKKCHQRMQSFREKGTTTILVSHNPKIISELCTRAAWLEKGEILLQGNADHIAQSYVQAQGS